MENKYGRYKTISEIGKSGVRWYYPGVIYDDFLIILRDKQGIKVFREMSDNDPVIGACLFAMKQILREAKWSAKPKNGKPQAKRAAKFLKENMTGMKFSWNDTINEILSMLAYGWSFHEIVYTRRADNMLVWKKLPIRLQTSYDRWKLGDNGQVIGMWQQPAPNYEYRYIPLKKALLFRPELAGDNPMGRSILRNAYRPWYFKKHIEETEAIGVERDLAGVSVLTPPEKFTWDENDPDVQAALRWAKKLLRNIRRDEQDGILKPYGWEFELIGSPGKRQFETTPIINRYSKEIAMSVLAQFILLGMERTGSYALSKDITQMFYICLEGWMDCIRDVFNKYAVPKLFAINEIDDPLPHVTHTNIRSYSLKDLADYVNKLVNAEVLTIDNELKDYLKNYARLREYEDVE